MPPPDAPPEGGIGPGSVVGRYTVVELVGQGGMGRVYRAHDPGLGRDVALKVIRGSPVADAGRLRSFEIEAKATAALTHPNLVTVHDAGLSAYGPFLVYELLDGETLQARLRKGDLTARKAVDYAIQIAEGLAAAHGKGIVHKDLKASNVFVTREGRVKILDFGLAQLQSQDPPADEDEPTASALSRPGLLQGTPGYMAPEQVLGQAADARSDIFSLGVVVYEMLAGRKPFVGTSPAAAIMAAVTEDPAPLSSRRVPNALRAVVDHCLEKRPDERFQSARDVALALRAVAPEEPRRGLVPVLLGIAAMLAVGIGVYAAWPRPRPDPVAPPPAPEFIPITATLDVSEIHPSLSPDGTRVAYASGDSQGNFDIYTANTAEQQSRTRLTSAPEFDCCPAWSPDGETIAFIRLLKDGGEIRTVPTRGGAEQFLRRVHTWFGSSVAWSPDGTSLVVSDWFSEQRRQFALFAIRVDTREAVRLSAPSTSVGGDAFGVYSPSGQTLAFARIPAFGNLMWAELTTMPAGGGREDRVARIEKLVGGLAWSPGGDELVYSAANFNETPRLWRLAVHGGQEQEPQPLNEDPAIATSLGAESVAHVSSSLRLSVAASANALSYSRSTYDTDVWRADLADLGREPKRVIKSTRADDAPQYSPDGSRIAFASARASPFSQIWVCEASGTDCQRVTSRAEPCGTPRWSPSGDQLAFDCSDSRGLSVVMRAELSPLLVQQVTDGTCNDAVPSWSRDGRSVYFASDRSGQWDVWKQGVQGTGAPVRVTRGGGFAAFESHDGRRVFYTKHSTAGLFVAEPATGSERQVSNLPSSWGYWTLGRDAAYVADAQRADQLLILRVPLEGGEAQPLGSVPGALAYGESGLALSPDGRSLLYVAAARGSDLFLMKNLRR
jgi:serine/threonine protein kinase/Tol biopolymer transport system component